MREMAGNAVAPAASRRNFRRGGCMLVSRDGCRAWLPAARDHPGRQREAVFRDLAGAREPDPARMLVADAMLDRLPQWPQPERLADDEAVQGEREDERL